jgi:hypothetical protein
MAIELIDPRMVAQAEGFVRRYLEMDAEEAKPGASEAMVRYGVIESALIAYRAEIRELQGKITRIKEALG